MNMLFPGKTPLPQLVIFQVNTEKEFAEEQMGWNEE